MLFIIDTAERRQAAADRVMQITRKPVMAVEIYPYKKSRSNSQNRLLWMWYKPIADHLGYTPEELHEEIKVRFIGVERKTVYGMEIIMPKSTQDLDTEAFTKLLDQVLALATELGITLPQPDDYNYAMGYHK